MPRDEKLSNLLRSLVRLLEEEADRNPSFARRLESVLGHRLSSKPKKERARPVAPKEVPDVLSALQQRGESEFRFWLRDFDLQTLKAIVKVNGFDVARLSQRWTDPDKFIVLIAEQAAARLRRGSGFLPERSASEKQK
jgi:hypothetical protein